MNLRLQTRLLILVGIGLVLLGAAWIGRHPPRGVGYYFPTWVGPGGPSSDSAERIAELTNLTTSLPLVLAALERSPSALGQNWQAVRDALPEFLQDHLSSYQGSDPEMPTAWLVSHSQEVEVARTVADHWSRWPDGIQLGWLYSQTPRALTNRPEYLALLRATAQGTNDILAIAAARLLAAYRPLNAANAAPIAQTLARQRATPTHPGEDQLLQEIAGQGSVPPPLTAALERWLDDSNGQRAALAGLTLGCLEPSRFPPNTVLEPRIRAMSLSEQGRFFRLLSRTEFHPVAASAWSVDFLVELLVTEPATNRPTPMFTVPVLRVLDELGPTAVAAAPAILPFFADANQQVARTAAKAFASVAREAPRFVPAVIPHLTNQTIAAPLLLWLTALGPDANAADGAVFGIALESTRYPDGLIPAPIMDPALARRYGLIPSGRTTGRNRARSSASPNWLRPSEIHISARESCPRQLAAYWPGFPGAHQIITNQIPYAPRYQYFPLLFERLPDSTLAELARRCLTNLTTGPPTNRIHGFVP